MGLGKDGYKVFQNLLRAGIFILSLGLANLVFVPGAMATGAFFQQIPEGYERSCNLCHSQVPVLNDFGQTFKSSGFKFPALTVPASPPDATGTTGQPAGKVQVTVAKEKPQAEVNLIVPGSVVRGEKTQLKARVTVGGKPVTGKQVQFFEETELFIKGKMILGQAVTDEEGIAAINYWPRAAEERVALVASVTGDDEIRSAETAASLALIQAGSLVEHVEGLRVPFAGTWVIILLVGAVWGAYLYVVYNTLLIRKSGERAGQQEVFELKDKQQLA
ncbi:hypothetical protein SY88_04600 [Clostridiales bacterium PH28_bin88]|nr:hypothetical protein SY88_04600 [Clostridiales bacterium PH28_bin88]